jgi:hemolysin III
MVDTAVEREAVGAPAVPSWRGRMHQAAFFVALPAGIILVSIARGTSARLAASIYAASLAGLYASSAAYHRLARSPRVRSLLKRLDHSMIFVLIGGTATPIGLLALDRPWSIVMLVTVWAGVAAGVVLKLLRVEGFRVLSGALYIALGWSIVLVAPQLVHGLRPASLILLGAGGLIYTAGAIVLLRRRPNPSPTTFGYHEVWHTMVIAASACHYAAVYLLLLPARHAIG